MAFQRFMSKKSNALAAAPSSRAGAFSGQAGQPARRTLLGRWHNRVVLTSVAIIALVGVLCIVGGVILAVHKPDAPTRNSSADLSTLFETGAALQSEIARTVRPAIQRTENLAKDPI